MDPGHAGHRSQPVYHKPFQILPIFNHHLQQIIKFAGNVITFQHFRHLADRRSNGLDLLGLVHLQIEMNKAEHIIANFFSI